MQLKDNRAPVVAALLLGWAAVAAVVEYLSSAASFGNGITAGLIGFIVSVFVCLFVWERQSRAAQAKARRGADKRLSLVKSAPIFAPVPGPGEPGYDPNYDPDEDKYGRRYYRDDD